MSIQRFSTGKQFVWLGLIFEVKRLLPGGQISIENILTAEVSVVPFIDLAQALFAGELHFAVRGEQVGERTTRGQVDLSDYPPRLREIAEYRLEVIRPLLALRPSQRTRSIVRARVAEVKEAQETGWETPKPTVSVASVYRWLSDYLESGNDIRSLTGNSLRQGGKGQSRLNEQVETIIRAVIEDRYYVAERVTTDDIYLEVLLRIDEENQSRHERERLPWPSRVTVWRRIGALDEKETLIAKRGKRAAEQQFAQYGSMSYPTLPLERVEIDHTRMDVIVVDGQDNLPLGRPTFTYCLDSATRYPLGFYIGFEPPSYLTVMECLYHAILTKGNVCELYGTQHNWIACGIPFALVVDNGKEFIGIDLQDACNCLGIELVQMPVKMPHFKAAVERMFGTVNTGLLHTLPGTTFSMPSQRGEYDSEREACITLEELLRVCHIFLLDVYAESFHRGLGDVPARRWEEVTQSGFFPRLPASPEDLKVLLGRVTYRKISSSGIKILNLRYNSEVLAPLRTQLQDQKAKIKYDPSDLGSIYVYDPTNQAYLEVEALDQEYARGLSLWKHRVILRTARQDEDKVDILALARAKRKIQEIIQQSKSSKKIRSRSRTARWEADGRSTEHTSNASELPVVGTRSSMTEFPPDASLPALNLSVSLEDLEQEGWSADYDLPIKNR